MRYSNAKRGGDLFRYLLEKFASFSGISGVQPKILLRDEKAFAEMEQTGHRLSQSYKGATHIVKMWEPNEYPQLAANEYFCLTVARKCGLDVPPYRLTEDGMALDEHRKRYTGDGLSLQENAKGSLSISKSCQRVITRALRDGWKGWHGFRGGLGSNLHSLGVPPKVIQEILRHADVATTETHYIVVDRSEANKAMKKLERAVGKEWAKTNKRGSA